MFCKYCGKTLPDGVKFCPSCGKPTPASGTGAPKPNPIPTPVNNSTNTFTGTGTGGTAQGFGTSYVSNPMPGQPMKAKKVHNIGNYILWAACAVTIISLFLPYCSTVEIFGQKASVSLMTEDTIEGGMMFLGFTAVVAVLNIFKLNILCIIGSVINLVVVLVFNSYIKDYMNYASGLVNYSIGHTLLLLGSIAMIAASIAALVLCIKQKNMALGR